MSTLAWLLPTAGLAQAADETLMSVGVVADGYMDQKEVWFELGYIDQRYVVPVDAMPDPSRFFTALQDAASTGNSVEVYFYVGSGYFEKDGAIPRYVVRHISYQGREIAGMRGALRKSAPANQAESALARGVAYFSGGRPVLAIPLLDAALQAGGLNASLRALALKSRGNAIMESVWSERETLTDAEDRQILRALEDFRAWATLEPDSMEAQTDIGYALRDLGAYDEALEVFGTILRRWPDYKIQAVTRIGATYRLMGDHQRALDVLDELVASDGPQEGMKFYYHRGWTLNELGRYAEARDEFTEGLKTQPDYGYAYQKRACSHAMLGALPEALNDQRRFNSEMEMLWRGPNLTTAMKHTRNWSRSVVAELERAIAKGHEGPVTAPCEGDWSAQDHRRERSRLLPGS